MGFVADIRALLVAASVANVYAGSMPDSVANCVGVFRAGGGTRELSGTSVEGPAFQVRVRNTDYPTGEAVCEAVKDALHGVNAVSATSGADILLIAQEGDILDLGKDESERYEWTVNFRTLWRRA